MTTKKKACPQCRSVGFHKMSCTEPYEARKRDQATTIAPTPSKSPQRPPKAILEAFCLLCSGTGKKTFAWGFSDPCSYCEGTGYDDKEKK